jgi:hypothetical protein
VKVTLDAEEYWKLRAICGDTQRLQVMLQAVNEQLKVAQSKQDACLADLALAHGLLETLPTFQLDDATLSLVMPEASRV